MADVSLTPGLRLAFTIAANEVFFEWVERAVAEPQELIDSGDLGSAYQGFHRGVVDEAGAASLLQDLAPWVDGELVASELARVAGRSAADFAADLVDGVSLVAGVEIGESILRLAVDAEAELPARLHGCEDAVRELAVKLAAKIAAGDASEIDDPTTLVP